MNGSVAENVTEHLRKLRLVVGAFPGVFMILITVFVSLRILSRWAGLGLIGMGEAAQILTLWIVFVGLYESALTEDHIRATWFVDQLPDRAREIVTRAALFLSFATVTIVLVSAWFVARDALSGETATGGLPLVFKDGSLFVGMLLLFVAYVYRIAAELRSGGTA